MVITAKWVLVLVAVILVVLAAFDVKVSDVNLFYLGIAAYTQLIQSAKWHQDAAKKFLAGEVKDYLPYLSSEGQQLFAEGLIDTTAVPA